MNVYLIKQENNNYYKIGITSKKPEERLKELQTGNPNKLVIVSSYKTTYKYLLETALHNHFKLKRVNLEWFELADIDITDFIKTCEKFEKSFEVLKNNPFFNRNSNQRHSFPDLF